MRALEVAHDLGVGADVEDDAIDMVGVAEDGSLETQECTVK